MLNYLYQPEVSHIVLLGKVYFSFLFWGFCRLEAFSAALVRDLTKRKNHTCFARITITCVIPGAPLALWDILTPSRFLSSRNGTQYGTYGSWDMNLWKGNHGSETSAQPIEVSIFDWRIIFNTLVVSILNPKFFLIPHPVCDPRTLQVRNMVFGFFLNRTWISENDDFHHKPAGRQVLMRRTNVWLITICPALAGNVSGEHITATLAKTVL